MSQGTSCMSQNTSCMSQDTFCISRDTSFQMLSTCSWPMAVKGLEKIGRYLYLN